MSGGNVDSVEFENEEGVETTITVEPVVFLLQKSVMEMVPYEGCEEDLGELIISLVSNIENRPASSRSVFPGPLDKLLLRAFPNHLFKDVNVILPELEILVTANEKLQTLAAAKVMETGQLSVRSILPRFRMALELPDLQSGESEGQFLESWGIPADKTELILRSPFLRTVMIQVFFLIMWAVLARHAEGDDFNVQACLHLAEEGDEVFPVRVETSSQSPPGLDPRDAVIAALQVEVAKLKSVASAAAAAPPAPLRQQRVPGRPARARPRAVVDSSAALSVSDPIEEDFSDSADDISYASRRSVASHRSHRSKGELSLASSRTVLSRSPFAPAPLGASARDVLRLRTRALQGPLMSAAIERTRGNYTRSEFTMDEMLLQLDSPSGVLIIGVDGLVLSMKMPPLSKHVTQVPKMVTSLFNPDMDPHLSGLGLRDVTPHLYPTTLEQFDALLWDQTDRVLAPSPLFGPELGDRPALARTLRTYRNLMQNLVLGMCADECSAAAMQRNAHHVTDWAVLLLFHINRWMRAMLACDLNLLLENFDSLWLSFYANKTSSKVGGGVGGGVPLLDALNLLGYRCSKCNRLGTWYAFCPTDACSTAHTKATPAKTVKGFEAHFKEWRLAQADDKAATRAAFRLTPLFLEQGAKWEAAAKAKAPAVGTPPSGARVQDYQHNQCGIIQHPLLNLRTN